MLDATVKFLADEVNLYLKRQTASSVVQVVPGGLTDDSGKWAVKEGTIGLALVNVEEERTLRAQVPERVFRNGSHIVRSPELKLNLPLSCDSAQQIRACSAKSFLRITVHSIALANDARRLSRTGYRN